MVDVPSSNIQNYLIAYFLLHPLAPRHWVIGASKYRDLEGRMHRGIKAMGPQSIEALRDQDIRVQGIKASRDQGNNQSIFIYIAALLLIGGVEREEMGDTGRREYRQRPQRKQQQQGIKASRH